MHEEQTRKRVASLSVNTICWSDNGDYILSGSDDRKLCVTNAHTSKPVAEIRSGHNANIFSARFIPNSRNKQVISCSGDGRIAYNEVEREDLYGTRLFNCHYGTTYEIMVVPNDSYTFLSCGEDCTVRWFDLRMKTRCIKEDCKEVHVYVKCGLYDTIEAPAPEDLMEPYVDPIIEQSATDCPGTSTVLSTIKSSTDFTVQSVVNLAADTETQPIVSSGDNASADTGTQPIVSSGDNTSADTETQSIVSSGDNASADTETQPIVSSGDNTSADTETQPIVPSGDNTSAGTETQPIVSSGDNTSADTGIQPIVSSGDNTSADTGTQPIISPGDNTSANTETQPIVSSGDNTSADAETQTSESVSIPGIDQSEQALTQAVISLHYTTEGMENSTIKFDFPNQPRPAKKKTEDVVGTGDENPGPSGAQSHTDTAEKEKEDEFAFFNRPSNDVELRMLSIQPVGSSVDVQLATIKKKRKRLEKSQSSDVEELQKANKISGKRTSKTQRGADDDESSSSSSEEDNNSRSNINENTVSSKDCENKKKVYHSKEADKGVLSKDSDSSPDSKRSRGWVHQTFTEELVGVHKDLCTDNSETISSSEVNVNSNTTFQDSLDVETPMEVQADVVEQSLDTIDTKQEDIVALPSTSIESSANGKQVEESKVFALRDRIEDNQPQVRRTSQHILPSLEHSRRLGMSGPSTVTTVNRQPQVDETHRAPMLQESNDADQNQRLKDRVEHSRTRTSSEDCDSYLLDSDDSDELTFQAASVRAKQKHRRSSRDISSSSSAGVTVEHGAEGETLDSPSADSTEHRIREMFRIRKEQKEKEELEMRKVHQPRVKRIYKGHRNSRTMIKEANFWGNHFVLSGSDCGHIFIWDRYTAELVMLLEGDKHVVNCVQPHPCDP
uniref:DDB1- and CUL4-associated factor 6-like n=1 Tax=Saccoglossus kowalevskii TaxID=10224 RepID=A0ABM0MW81_SACKO